MEVHCVQLVLLSLHNLLLTGSRTATDLNPSPKINPDYCCNNNTHSRVKKIKWEKNPDQWSFFYIYLKAQSLPLQISLCLSTLSSKISACLWKWNQLLVLIVTFDSATDVLERPSGVCVSVHFSLQIFRLQRQCGAEVKWIFTCMEMWELNFKVFPWLCYSNYTADHSSNSLDLPHWQRVL